MSGRLPSATDAWVVYMLECGDGTFYTGVTNNMQRRLDQHNAGKGARYTRGRRPVVLRYREPCDSRSHALAREAALKRLTREAKQQLLRANKRRTHA